ncbi:MAG: ATP-grasp domain-containing protein [Archangiaceae bacterium]|nr:ATP-grasp domain-containing protein [Archangiaceae bacterium]
MTALAVRALVEHGHQVVLHDPSPVSPAEAHRTYLEPLTAEACARVIAEEKPDAILAGVGQAATTLALELKKTHPQLDWLGPKVFPVTLAVADADTVVEVAGTFALGQIEQRGDTWTCPAPRHDAALDQKAVQALRDAGFHGCARVSFKAGALVGIDPIVGAASAFSSQALGVSIPRLAVRLALGLDVDVKPKAAAVAVRRAVGGAEVMSLAHAAAPVAPGKSVVLLGAAGVEAAVRAEGLEPIVIDADPSSVSEARSRYYEPLTLEAVLKVCKAEQPRGVVVQLGGAAAVSLADALEKAGVPVLGTPGRQLARALDRAEFARVVAEAGLQQPGQGTAKSFAEAKQLAGSIGYPLLARTGTALKYVADEAALHETVKARGEVTLQAFLAEATQACVELLRDRTGRVVVSGVVENVEQAGVHAADAACTLPPHSLKSDVIERLKDVASALAHKLEVVGLLEVNFALQGKQVWVLDANPRATRTLPFVSKATGLDLPGLSVRLMLGRTLEQLGLTADPVLQHCAVRESVFDENVALGPTQRSTGAVMAVARSLAVAFGKSQLAAGTALPETGTAFISVTQEEQPAVVDLAQRLTALGFSLACTEGTHVYLQKKGVASQQVRKVSEGSPHVAELIRNGDVSLVICTVGLSGYDDGQEIRSAARVMGVPNFTTVEAARLAVGALEERAACARSMVPLQAFAVTRP